MKRSALPLVCWRVWLGPEVLDAELSAGTCEGTACRAQRCTVHKHRNLLAHAPERLHEEITADYTDMIYAATPKEIEARRKAFLRKWRLQTPCRRRQPGGSRRSPVHLHAPAAEPVAQRQHHQRNRAAARRVQATHQDADRAALGRNRRHAVLGAARLRPDQHAQGRRLADAGNEARSISRLTSPPDPLL